MDLNAVYKLHEFILRKQRGAFVTYEELDEIYNLGQLDLINEYMDEYALTGKIHNALQPFKKNYIFTNTTSVNGFVDLPSDYLMALLSYTQTYNNNTQRIEYGEIRFHNEDSWVNAINSQLRPATKKLPAAKIIGGEIELFPKEVNAGILNYIRKPNAPVYAYSQVGRAVTYNANTSVQLEWSDLYITKVIMKALAYQSINLNEQQIAAFAAEKEKEVV